MSDACVELRQYGYALLCCQTLRDVTQLAVKFQQLATPTGARRFREEDGEAVWSFDEVIGLDADDALYRFLVELQYGIHQTLARDMLDQPAAYRNPITVARAAEVCERMLVEARTASGLTRRIYKLPMETPGQFDDMEVLARKLDTSSRTLRRHLAKG